MEKDHQFCFNLFFHYSSTLSDLLINKKQKIFILPIIKQLVTTEKPFIFHDKKNDLLPQS